MYMGKENKEESGKKNKLPKIEITELFMATCGKGNFEKCFYGTISREKDENGKEKSCSSKIYIPKDGYIWSRAEDQRKLGNLLDSIVKLRIVCGLHKDNGLFIKIAENEFFLN